MIDRGMIQADLRKQDLPEPGERDTIIRQVNCKYHTIIIYKRQEKNKKLHVCFLVFVSPYIYFIFRDSKTKKILL